MSTQTIDAPIATFFDAVAEARRELLHGDPAIAVTTLSDIISDDPDNAQAHEMLGVALVRTGRPLSGIAHLMCAVDLAPTSRTARFDLAIALHKAGNGKAAMIELRRLLDLDPGYSRARQALAVLEGKDPKEAMLPKRLDSSAACYRQPWEYGRRGTRDTWHA